MVFVPLITVFIAVFVAFSLPAVFVAFLLPAVFVAFLLLFASSILHGWSRQRIFMLCCFLTLFFCISKEHTLSQLHFTLHAFFFNYSTECVCVCVCVCVSALILHLFSLLLHNMMRLHFTKVYTMYHCCNCLAGSLRHYVITSLRHYGTQLVSVLCTALSLFSSFLFGSLFFVIHTETRPSQCACVLSAAQCVVLDAMYECGEACY